MKGLPLFQQINKLLISKYLIVTFTIFTFFLLLFVKSNQVEAALKASSSYDVHINVTSRSVSQVEYLIHLTNESDNFFIRDYSVIIDYTDITELRVLENGEVVDFRKEHIEDKVRIKVMLKDPLVDPGDKTDICLRFQTRQLFKTDGLLSRLYIPTLVTEEDLQSANFTLVIPDEIGNISYFSIKNKSSTQSGSNKIFEYKMEDAPKGVLILFGTKQQFDIVYNYKLKNDSNKKTRFKIVLPPDSVFQKTFFVDAVPLPSRSLSDENGNNIIEYIVNPMETKEVRIAGVTIFSQEWEQQNKSLDDVSNYLAKTDIWNFDDDDVRIIVNNITRTDYLPSENTKLIYEYLMLNFDYSENELSERKSASKLIEERNELSCINFTDLFITLSRAADIPTRQVIGYSNWNRDLNTLHSWIEFFDDRENKWITCDPCLEKLMGFDGFGKVDLNRVILVYRDVSDVEPEVVVPFLKLQGLDNDTLEINPSSFEYVKENQTIGFNYEVGTPDLLFKRLPLTFSITNNSQSVFRFNEVIVDGRKVNFMNKHIEEGYVESVFPGQFRQISIDLSQLTASSVEKIGNYHFEASGEFGGSDFVRKYDFKLKRPFTWFHAASWFTAGIFALITLGIFLLLVKKVRSRPLRRKMKYKYKFRESKIKSLLDIPVALR